MGKVISILNHKGGTGKTTTTANLGAALARTGRKVLLIDLDAQCNLTHSLALHGDIWAAMRGEAKDKPFLVGGNLYGIGATPELTQSELFLPTARRRGYILKGVLRRFTGLFNYVLIDCAPSVGLLTTNALTASTGVIVPTSADYMAIGGLKRVLEYIGEIKQRTNKALAMEGILITRYQQRRTLDREAAAFLVGRFGDKVFKTRIRENVSLAEAPGQQQSIFDYSPRCNGAKDYEEFAKELTGR